MYVKLIYSNSLSLKMKIIFKNNIYFYLYNIPNLIFIYNLFNKMIFS